MPVQVENLIYPPLQQFATSEKGMGIDVDTPISAITSSYRRFGADRENTRYMIFIPRVFKPSQLDRVTKSALSFSKVDKLIKDLFNQSSETTKSQFRQNLESPVKGKDVNIALPMKAIEVNVSPTWQDGDSSVFSLAAIKKDVIGEVGGRVVGSLLSKASQSGAFGTILSQAGLSATNPTRKYFTGAPGPGFSFSWEMSPRNADDAKLIKKIYKSFQFFSLPQSLGQSQDEQEQKVFFKKSPAIWNIKYKANTGNATNMLTGNNEFEFMVCTGVDVAFGEGDTWQTYPDGFPPVIKLTVKFESFFNISNTLDFIGYNEVKNYSELLQAIDNESGSGLKKT